MSDSQKTVEPVVIPAPPARPQEYDAATQAALEHIDRQTVRTVADGRLSVWLEGIRAGRRPWACWAGRRERAQALQHRLVR
ncbi:hypothetical protein AB0945_34795 [Streptomyces sp. NPDC005474]|uniref:hypothetical protein n=1 Tax=Streptomyces sp. NPDC005474 TaxID=3154878 RepID=UPI003452C145